MALTAASETDLDRVSAILVEPGLAGQLATAMTEIRWLFRGRLAWLMRHADRTAAASHQQP